MILSINRNFRTPITTTWRDDGENRLEKSLAAIAAGLIVAGEAAFRLSLIEEKEYEEQLREWRAEQERNRIPGLEAQRIVDLRASGALLSQAEEIRTLVARVKAAVMAGETDIRRDELARWERWALDKADRLDPVLSGQFLSHLRVPELDGAKSSE